MAQREGLCADRLQYLECLTSFEGLLRELYEIVKRVVLHDDKESGFQSPNSWDYN